MPSAILIDPMHDVYTQAMQREAVGRLGTPGGLWVFGPPALSPPPAPSPGSPGPGGQDGPGHSTDPGTVNASGERSAGLVIPAPAYLEPSPLDAIIEPLARSPAAGERAPVESEAAILIDDLLLTGHLRGWEGLAARDWAVGSLRFAYGPGDHPGPDGSGWLRAVRWTIEPPGLLVLTLRGA